MRRPWETCESLWSLSVTTGNLPCMTQTTARPLNKRALLARMRQHKLSVRGLAREVSASGTDLTHAAIFRWLAGDANPSDDKLIPVARHPRLRRRRPAAQGEAAMSTRFLPDSTQLRTPVLALSGDGTFTIGGIGGTFRFDDLGEAEAHRDAVAAGIEHMRRCQRAISAVPPTFTQLAGQPPGPDRRGRWAMKALMPSLTGRHPATVAFINGQHMCATVDCPECVPQAGFYQGGGMRDPIGLRRGPLCVARGWPGCMPATDTSPALTTSGDEAHGSSDSSTSDGACG